MVREPLRHDWGANRRVILWSLPCPKRHWIPTFRLPGARPKRRSPALVQTHWRYPISSVRFRTAPSERRLSVSKMANESFSAWPDFFGGASAHRIIQDMEPIVATDIPRPWNTHSMFHSRSENCLVDSSCGWGASKARYAFKRDGPVRERRDDYVCREGRDWRSRQRCQRPVDLNRHAWPLRRLCGIDRGFHARRSVLCRSDGGWR